MAGGRGLRLHPITEHTPKPLIKVGSKPILQQVIESFVKQGFRKIWISVNYKAELIKNYFGSGAEFGATIRYIDETEPMGTGGALHKAPKWDKPFIVCNADVKADVNYSALMEFHARSNCVITVCAALHQQQIQFGVITQQEDRLIEIREKPIENFAVNAGIYVLEPKAHDYLPNGAFGMPDLVHAIPFDGARSQVAVYSLDGYWIDIGNFEDLGRARGG